MRRCVLWPLAVLFTIGCFSAVSPAQEPGEQVFSGPQAGEKITPFTARLLLGEKAGAEIDLVAKAKEKPLFLVFVHERTRPSLGAARLLLNYAATRGKDGLHAGLVFLTEDATELETWAKRAAAALPNDVPICISTDGAEGPGAYGLNRKVALTVLVAKDSKVHANFALVQPSIQADVPQILKPLVEVLGGGDVPTLAQLGVAPERNAGEVNLRPFLAPLIKLTATPEEVERAAKGVDDYVARNAAAQKELGRIGRTIIESGKLKDYGTPAAQEYLKRWAEKYGGR